MSLFCAVLHVDCLLSACLFVKTVAKSGPSNAAVTHDLCGLDIVSYYLCTPNLWRVAYQTATRTLCAFLKRARKFGFCDENYTTAELHVVDKADARLFRPVQRPEHCHHLLPDTINSCSMELRHRGHIVFALPQCRYNLYKNSFILRRLFKYV